MKMLKRTKRKQTKKSLKQIGQVLGLKLNV